MKKIFLMKLLAVAMSAGLMLQPLSVYAYNEAEATVPVAEDNLEPEEEKEPEELPKEESEETLVTEKHQVLEVLDLVPKIESTNVGALRTTAEVELPELQNVRIENKLLYWDLIPKASYYRIEINSYTHSSTQSPTDLYFLCEAFKLQSGETYTVKLTAVNNNYEDISKTYEIDYKFDNTESLRLKNVYIEDDLLYWDLLGEYGTYSYDIYIEKLGVIVATRASGPVDLKDIFKRYNVASGTYTVSIRGYNDEEQSEWSDVEYIYNVDKTVISAVEATSDIKDILVDKKAVTNATITATNPDIVIEQTSLLIKDGIRYSYYTEDVFEPGTYKIKVGVSVANDKKETCKINTGLKLTVDGKPWTEDWAEMQDDEVTRIYYYSPEFEVTEQTTPPTPVEKKKISSASATSNYDNFLKYGDSINHPFFICEADVFDAPLSCETFWVKKQNDGRWKQHSSNISEGIYRYNVKLSIYAGDIADIGKYEFAEDITLTVNGKEWTKVKATNSLVEFQSEDIEVTKPALPVIQNVRIEGDYLYWDALEGVEGVTGYYVIMDRDGAFAVESPLYLVDFCEFYLEIEPGTYDVSIVASNKDFAYVSQVTPVGTYTYRKTSEPAEKKKISSAIVTSNYDQILKYGEEIKQPSFEVENDTPITIEAYWMKEDEDEAGRWTRANGEVKEGLYICHVDVRVSDKYADTYELADNFKLTVNDTDWSRVNAIGLAFGVKVFHSENIKVTAPVVNPEPQPEPSPQPGPTPGPSPQPTPGPVSNTSSNSNAINPVTIANPQTPTTGAASDVKTTSSTLSSTTQKSNTQNTEAPAVDQESTNEETPVQESEPAENEQITDPETPLAKTEDSVSESIADSDNSNLLLIIAVAILAVVGIEEFIRRTLKNRV